MGWAWVVAAALLPAPVQGEQVRYETHLVDLGEENPIRLSGLTVQREFFFPSPVRQMGLTNSEIVVHLRASALLDKHSRIEVLLNDTLVKEFLVDKPQLELRCPLEGLRGKALPSDFLKVTVRGDLKHAALQGRCTQLASGELWIEIDPRTGISTWIDNTASDWLAMSRLPLTLRRKTSLYWDPTWTPAQRDVALKLAAWITYHAPLSAPGLELTGRKQDPLLDDLEAAEDQFVIESPRQGASSGISIRPLLGNSRQITLSIGSDDDASRVWSTLADLRKLGLPGTSWLVESSRQARPEEPGHQTEVPILQLEPSFCQEISGLGEMVRTFGFDAALFSRKPFDLRLRIPLIYQQVLRQGSAMASVYINDRLAYTAPLPLGTTQTVLDVDLKSTYLRDENRVILKVQYQPTEEECQNPLFFFHFQPGLESSLRIKRVIDQAETNFEIAHTARRYFARSRFLVALKSPDERDHWEVAVAAVGWIQKLNPRALVHPGYTTAPGTFRSIPGLLIGFGADPSLGARPEILLPIQAGNSSLSLMGEAGASLFKLAPGQSAGIWQTAYPASVPSGAIPAPWILADGWGPNGGQVLKQVSRQIRELPWLGQASAVIGDGESGVYGFEPRKLRITVNDRPLEFREYDWSYWRWWILIPLWGGVLGGCYWVYRRMYRVKPA